MSEHRHPYDPAQAQAELERRLRCLEGSIGELTDAYARMFLAGELERFTFDGVAGITQLVDDHGSNALSYAVYNPNEFRVFVGLAGGSADAGSGLIVPKQKLVVAPLQINGHVALAADAEELGEKTGSILRVRFPTPQPFFVGALA